MYCVSFQLFPDFTILDLEISVLITSAHMNISLHLFSVIRLYGKTASVHVHHYFLVNNQDCYPKLQKAIWGIH